MKPCVLVADGDHKGRESLRRSLELRGYEVETAGDGLECISKIIARLPVMVVLDIDLLWGGAEGVLARLRDDRDMRSIRVILTTDKDKPEELAKLIKDPVVACFRKPLRMKALSHWLRQAERRSLGAVAR